MDTFHAHIKAATELAHAQAEEAPFISELMGGSLSPQAYLGYLRALLPIYQLLELRAEENAKNEPFKYFFHRELQRSDLLARDIVHLEEQFPDNAPEETLESVSEYCSTLTADISPARLLAHHYIRYLGDLSGGQAIAKLVSRHYKISSEALNFYNFTSLGDLVFYKSRYRDLLNLAMLTDQDRTEFLDEVTKLYKLSRQIFLELGDRFSVASKI